MDLSKLQAGDVLLYAGTGLYGLVIRIKCWHPVGHCEVYVGAGMSAASRDGKGVAIYPLRTADLLYVLRPKGMLFSRKAAMFWFWTKANGKPYAWADLLSFVGLNINTKGMICSEFATSFLRAGGIPIFGDEPAAKVAPFEFLLSELLEQIPVITPISQVRST